MDSPWARSNPDPSRTTSEADAFSSALAADDFEAAFDHAAACFACAVEHAGEQDFPLFGAIIIRSSDMV